MNKNFGSAAIIFSLNGFTLFIFAVAAYIAYLFELGVWNYVLFGGATVLVLISWVVVLFRIGMK